MPEFFTSPQGRRIAFHQIAGKGPGVVFLGGFRSDMEGTKALHLEAWARETGRAFLRFDYSGHGKSGGDFLEGSIGDWAEDAAAALARTEGPQVLVGSSMGGWIALLLARTSSRVAGLVTIAAAPDFTEDSMWARFTPQQRQHLAEAGQIDRPSSYAEEPYVITRRLIEDGRLHLVLRSPLNLTMPVRFLQGTSDIDVSPKTALRLLDHATGADLRLILVKDADHRFSTPACLDLIVATLRDLPDAA